MDTLDGSEWDVLIVGTGLQQSLLALALSRSAKKILHIDENDYYGGAEAAFSLQEAESWVQRVNRDAPAAAYPTSTPDPSASSTPIPPLGPSRAYSLALSPQLIYARSKLLQYLVSSRVYRQLDFLAAGSWWVYSPGTGHVDGEGGPSTDGSETSRGSLLKVPNGREDVFRDSILDFKAKRALMKFLRFIGEYEGQTDVWDEHRSQPFPAFLSEQFRVPAALQAPLLALTLSAAPSNQTTTEFALPRIARHLRSIGFFGAGFGAVLPKWGGMSEISQVACRACAVGGATYVLGKGLVAVEESPAADVAGIKLRLRDGEAVTARWVVEENSPQMKTDSPCSRSISIVASTLGTLFRPTSEDAPTPACAVVFFPSGSLSPEESEAAEEIPPVNIYVHSSDTGECPAGQSVLYASTSLSGAPGFQLLNKAVQCLLSSVDAIPAPTVLWSIQYGQPHAQSTSPVPADAASVLRFPPSSVDLAFDDSVLDKVKDMWQQIMADVPDPGNFMVFEDRQPEDDDAEA